MNNTSLYKMKKTSQIVMVWLNFKCVPICKYLYKYFVLDPIPIQTLIDLGKEQVIFSLLCNLLEPV